MTRRNRTTDKTVSPQETRVAVVAKIKLRLLENAYVRGELTKAGRVIEFPKDEAEKRLKATQLWERA